MQSFCFAVVRSACLPDSFAEIVKGLSSQVRDLAEGLRKVLQEHYQEGRVRV